MKKHLSLLLCFVGIGAWAADPDPYYGKKSTEAIFTFDHYVTFNSDVAQPDEKEAKEEIDDQVEHLFGSMQASSVKAVPKTEHEFTNIKITNIGGKKWKATYHYSGKILIENTYEQTYAVWLPIDPDNVFERGMTTGYDAYGKPVKMHPCITDQHYKEEEDFWYFWNPKLAGCPLREGVDYETLTGNVERLPNTVTTYPEYNRLADDKGEIRIDLLAGMDDEKNNRNPFYSTDPGADNVKKVRNILLSWGFSEGAWRPEMIEAITKVEVAQRPYVMEMWKQEAKAKVVVRIFFGPTSIDDHSKAFHDFFRESLATSSMMIYSGHSGLSENLDAAEIEKREGYKLEPNKNRYQLYYFDSCSSYPYYTQMYFDRKKSATDKNGTKNLDVMTNGLLTYFSVPHDTIEDILRSVELWASGQQVRSYQSMVDVIDSDNLMGISGDEDNPTTPEF